MAVFDLDFNCFRLFWATAFQLLIDRKRFPGGSRSGVEFRQGDWAEPAMQSSRVSSSSQTDSINIHGGLPE